MFFDTHTHLHFEHYANDLPAVLHRAASVGVVQMVSIGIDPASCARSIALAEQYPPVHAAVGIHPGAASQWTPAVQVQLRDWAQHAKVRAIGEIGLDYYRNRAPREIQAEVFRHQIRLALDMALPVIIHSREAHEDTMRILEEEGAAATGVVMHCFSGGPELATRCIERGYFVSLGGSVTFKNATLAHEVARQVPLEHLLVETDAPFLTPHPHRGQRNEPAYVRLVAESIAALRQTTLAEIAAVTLANACRCFRIPLPGVQKMQRAPE